MVQSRRDDSSQLVAEPAPQKYPGKIPAFAGDLRALSRLLSLQRRRPDEPPITPPFTHASNSDPLRMSDMRRLLIFIYGLLCYSVFFATFLYAVGFIGNFWVPKSIDSPPEAPLITALLTNLALVTVFGIQHSVMARPGFKRWWTRMVPEPAERSTYVLFSSVALIFLFVFWQPMGGVVGTITAPIGRAALYGAFAFGWGLLLLSTFLINHFDLLGLRQVWLQLLGKPYRPLAFQTPWLYRYVRHPLYVGWLFIFWA